MALFFAAFKTILTSSSSVTIRDPNAIEPSERVDARTKADSVGCLGWRMLCLVYRFRNM